jgi:mannose-6-phosphate isomerase class I
MTQRDDRTDPMPVYPLRFAPICQYRPWGGRRLASLFSMPLPGDDPIGEAWLLSDREGHASFVANGPQLRVRIFLCEHFGLWRIHGASLFQVGAAEAPRVLVCIDGDGQLEDDGVPYAISRGDELLLPAALGVCTCSSSDTITLLELSLPEAV